MQNRILENRLVNGRIVGDPIGKYEGGRKFRPVKAIEFTAQMINDRWPLRIPKFLSDYHSWWDIWEKARNESMAYHLKPGMLLYEIGAYDGWQAALYAKFVGPRNVVLIEPTGIVWPNIKTIWEENWSADPAGCYMGFCSNENRGDGPSTAWPNGPDYSQFLKGTEFSLPSQYPEIPARKLDDLTLFFGVPQAINLDVEGFEVAVLEGARVTLEQSHPLLWVSAHSGDDQEKICGYLGRFGYRCQILGADHETHLFFFAEGS